jgi:signal transduction histidine kinase
VFGKGSDKGSARSIGLPAPTIRLRLTVAYGLVFLVTGAVLLTIGYFAVRQGINGFHFRERSRLRLFPHPPLVSPSQRELARDFHQQFVASELHRLIVEYLLALALMTLISVVAGWLLAGRALRPLRDITATARRVSSENLGERIGLVGPADELKELADTFDRMLGRLDGAFASQRHFVANASHELRTPLAIMRTEVDVALADPNASAEELRGMGEAVRETVDRCEGLIEALLMLARSEAVIGREEPVDLGALAALCVTDLHARAQALGVRVKTDLPETWVRGEPHLLERMIANLIDNAIRHNEPGGYINVRAATRGHEVELIVRNGGAVIEPGEVQALAEPFRRLNRAVGGFGLGLSIVRSVAEVHGGTAELTAPADGGLQVRIAIPAAAIVDVPRKQRSLTRS